MKHTAWFTGLVLFAALASAGCSVDSSTESDEGSTEASELVQSDLAGTWRFLRGEGPGMFSGLTLNADGTYVGELLQNCAQEVGNIERAECAPRIVDGAAPAGSNLARGTWKLVRKPSWCGDGSLCADLTGNNFLELEGAFYRFEPPGNRPVPLRLVLGVSQPLVRNQEMRLTLAGAFQLEGVYGGPFPNIDVVMKRTANASGGDMFCAKSSHCQEMFYAMIACPAGLDLLPLCNAGRACEAACVAPKSAGYGDACNTRPDHGELKPCITGMSCRETNLAGDADVCRTP